MELSFVQKDRAAGSLLAMACGDALGAGYEFQPRIPFTKPIGMVGGNFGFAPGEWTDDTSMAIVIAEVAATGADLRTETAQDQICEGWRKWRQSAKDVGVQTQTVINRGGNPATAAGFRAAAAHLHRETGRTAGNGSLMRTAPVALAFLHDRHAMAEAAMAISGLTHYDPVAGEACVLWCEAIRQSVLTGNVISPEAGLDLLRVESQDFWKDVIAESELKQPQEFPNNGWVISAFQAAWSAIKHSAIPANRPEFAIHPAQHLQTSLERAVRVGNDTDTVAAIAGSLVGAIWGSSAIPANWLRQIHGYPDYSAKDLTRLAILTVQNGQDQPGGWPSTAVTTYHESAQPAVELLPGLYLAGQSALQDLGDFDVVVSLSRVGTQEVKLDFQNHIRISVLDNHDAAMNPHLALQYIDVADLISEQLSANKKVLLHCVHAHTRTPSFAAAYLIWARGLDYPAAKAAVQQVLPAADFHAPFSNVLQTLSRVRPTTKYWESADKRDVYRQESDCWFLRRGGAWIEVEAAPEVLIDAAVAAVAEYDEAEAKSFRN